MRAASRLDCNASSLCSVPGGYRLNITYGCPRQQNADANKKLREIGLDRSNQQQVRAAATRGQLRAPTGATVCRPRTTVIRGAPLEVIDYVARPLTSCAVAFAVLARSKRSVEEVTRMSLVV